MAKKVVRKRSADSAPAAAPTAAASKPRITGNASVAPRVGGPKHRSGYRAAEHGKAEGHLPSFDLTLKKDAQVALVQPKGGLLVWRPVPALDPDDPTQFLPYRYSVEQDDFHDFTRNYTGAAWAGYGKARSSFILYDKATKDNYDIHSNPYQVLYDRWKRVCGTKSSVELPREFRRRHDIQPSMYTNLFLKVGDEGAILPRPATLYFFFGVVYARGTDEKYYGAGKRPRGLGEKDMMQVIQLKNTAGSAVWSEFNLVKDKFAGTPSTNFEREMVHGDPVALEHGRFVSTALMEGAAESRTFQQYGAAITKELVINGSVITNTVPALTEADAKLLKARSVFFDDILYFPEHEEICEICAKLYKDIPWLLEYGWADNPEFFTSEVDRILNSATSGPSGAIPDDQDGDDGEEQPTRATQSKKPQKSKPGKKSAVVQQFVEATEDDDEYEEVEVEGEAAEEDGEYEYEYEDEDAAVEDSEDEDTEDGAEEDDARIRRRGMRV
jgi:hypothetical protein